MGKEVGGEEIGLIKDRDRRYEFLCHDGNLSISSLNGLLMMKLLEV